MSNKYGFVITEEEFKRPIDKLLGKETGMADYDFGNNEEDLRNLKNQLKNAKQATARQALSEIIGIDLDKVEKIINGGQIVFSNEENEQEEQTESESETNLLRDDVFIAQDHNGLSDVYIAEELNIGAVVSIGGIEVFHILDCAHGDQAHTAWVDPMGRVMSDQVMARLAQDVNAANETTVVKIIHLG